MGKKGTKSFKHDTPLIKTDVKKLGKKEIDKKQKWVQFLLKQMLLN